MHLQHPWIVAAAGALFVATALAHGGHDPKPEVSNSADWATRHMAEEHHISDFDSHSFFTLHDFDNDGLLSPSEIARTYGLFDPSSADLPPTRRQEVTDRVLALFDSDRDGLISRDEWSSGHTDGKALPDMGTGPGHHGDDEYEYEIHHWEKYHDDNTKLEDLTHPEDIEHFRKHEALEAEEERLEQLARQPIVLENVPDKFRRVGSGEL